MIRLEIEPMSAEEFRIAREQLGLSRTALGRLLLVGRDPGRAVKRYETGVHHVPGGTTQFLRLLIKYQPARVFLGLRPILLRVVGVPLGPRG